jgi:UDP-2,3-diacylglucosamine hydrolase
MTCVYVVSDLHMFCNRSNWEQHLDDIEDAARQADVFVFNGDTFDFKWSTKSSLEETVEAAIAYLKGLAERHQHCQFHINLGNHDHVEPFIAELRELAYATPNVTWHRYFFRIGSTVFLHGDAAQRRMTHRKLEKYRTQWGRQHKPRGNLQNRIYDAAIQANAHVAVSKVVYPEQRTIENIADYLEDVGLTAEHGVKQVYFGHTHVPIEGYTYRGITFHNGGAPMPGMDFSLLQAQI